MEQINPVQAQRVWQRVRGEDASADPLPRLLALEAEVRHTYHYLQKNTPLHDSRLLSQLREESRRFSCILMGLCRAAEKDVTVQAPPSVRGNAEGLLQRCYRTRCQIIALVQTLPSGQTCGASLLQQKMEHHALTVLELLGQISRK